MEVLYVFRGRDRSHEIQTALGGKHRVRPVLGPLHKRIQNIDTSNTQIIITFVDSLIDDGVLQQCPKLRMIATQSTGVDHINIEACKKRGITVAYVPGYGGSSVGELAMLLLLGIARNLKDSLRRTRIGNFSRSEDRGFELRGKTIGIIGTGAIGAYVAKLAYGFGMNILLHDLKPDKKLAKEVSAKYSSDLRDLLPRADIFSFHLPLVPATHHMISYEELALMKRGAVIINTARGGIIYSPALLEAIENEHVKGAGLDVLELEQYLYSDHRAKGALNRAIVRANRKLMHHPKVLHTLHLGAQTEEAGDTLLQTTIANVLGFLAGKPTNLVSPHHAFN